MRPLVMGVLNVTPDSFSDGGRHADTEQAVRRGARMIAEGADIIDVGGESTRPGAVAVDTREELRRVIPVLEALHAEHPQVPLSIDTCKASVATAALAAGAEIVNDITALSDPAMPAAIARGGAGVVLMHCRGTPRTMSRNNNYTAIGAEVAAELADRVELALAAGIQRESICLDPGFGFAKVGWQNYQLLRDLSSLLALGFPLLVGASRKSFIGLAISLPPDLDPRAAAAANFQPSAVRSTDERMAGSLAFAVAAIARGALIIRTHDVSDTCDAARVALHCWESPN